MEQNIFERIRTIIAEQLGRDESEVIPEARLVEDLGADSLDVIELAMALEVEFQRELPDEDLEKLFTVGEIVEYIEKVTVNG